MHAVVVARTSLRRRLAQPSALHAASAPLQRPWAAAGSLALRAEPSLAARTAWQLQHHAEMSTSGPSPPKIVAAKALAARLRRKAKKKALTKVHKVKPETPVTEVETLQRQEEEALLKAAARATATNASTADAAVVEAAEEVAAVPETPAIADVPPTPEASPVVEKPKKKKQQPQQQQQAQAAASAPVTQEASAAENAEAPADAVAVVPAPVHPPLPAPPKRQPKPLKDLETDKITMTLKEIETLQKQLPSVEEVASLVGKLRRESFVKGQTLFDLYRIYGNPFLDENFLTPGVLACCEAKKPAQGIQIVRDMLEQGRKVEESTLRALLDVCDETSAAREVIELWDLMDKAGVKLELRDYNKFLDICHRRDYLDGAIKVLKVLRLHRSISVHSYMHWLNQATLVWRSDVFFDLLMEMRLSGVEPEILSLTSLESGRKDRALTVMEGVRAVGLDPCFAMSAVFSSMQYSVYKNGPAAEAITEGDVSAARKKFGDLRAVEIDWPTKPIPQVLETQAAGLILQQETFRRLKLSQVQRIDELLQMLPITTNMTINLRKQLQRMSLLVNTHRVKRDARRIAAEYDSGKSLIELSLTHNYPPVSLMRIILKERGLSAPGIKRALSAPTTHLSKRDQNELRKATGYDSIHRSDPFIGAAMYNADSLETTIAHFLRARGIRFKTEDELGDEQHEKYGRRVLSPDILLLDPVVVNGTPIRWIDAKNYYGAHIVSKRLISKQLASYVKEWGPGAIVFGMGFSDMFSVPGVVCLDTTPFPKTRSDAIKMRTQSMLQSVVQAFSWKKHLGSDLTQEYPSQPEGRGSRARGAKTREDDDEDEDEDVEAAVREAKPRGGSKATR